VLGSKVVSIDPAAKVVEDDQGRQHSYEKLLMANGGSPRKLPFGGERVIYFRNLDDYRALREHTGRNLRFGVIGGGFTGSEIAAALRMNGEQVSEIFPEEGIGARVYPRELALFLNDYFRQKGVDVLAGEGVEDIQDDGRVFSVRTNLGKQLEFDVIVAGIGIVPNIQLAETAGLKVGNGIEVNELLQTSDDNIYAAGDVAEFFAPVLGKRKRLEHEDNAKKMGRQAGRNMAGAAEPYTYLPFFYSDLFELGYEALGELDSRLETVAYWKEPYEKGVVYYLADGRVRGVLLWNTWDALPAALEMIKAEGPFTEETLKGRIG
jgi:NADPH-dependent 2,4-dienoyl-CoA reductase/sulfur reductase-like enzyme